MLCRVHETGQGMVEYAFLLLLIAMFILVLLMIFGQTIGNVFSRLNSSLASY
jgi:Flp pilus assembly pilin Flp